MRSNPEQKYLFPMPDPAKVRECARQLIEALERDQGLSEMAIAAMIGAEDVGPVTRLKAKATKKVPASLFLAAGRIDGAYIQPYMALMGLKAMPAQTAEAFNALPALGALVGKLAASVRDGGGIDHLALAGMLTELREADGAISMLRARASELGMSA